MTAGRRLSSNSALTERRYNCKEVFFHSFTVYRLRGTVIARSQEFQNPQVAQDLELLVNLVAHAEFALRKHSLKLSFVSPAEIVEAALCRQLQLTQLE